MGVLVVVAALACGGSTSADDTPTYERDIRPLLRKHCTICHATRKLDDPDTSGGLALDALDAIRAGTKDRKVIADNAADSSLFARLNDPDDDRRMPRDADPWPEARRDLIRRWIEAGLPRGEPAAAPALPKARKAARTLDVAIPIEAKYDDKPVRAVLKVGPLPAVTALAFQPDGRALAVGTVGQVVLWDLDEVRPTLILGDLPGTIHALAFRPDGQALAVGGGLSSRSGLVRVYDLDGSIRHDFDGHEDAVYGLAFRPDGGQLASASFDGTVRLWNLDAGEPAAVFRGHSDFVYDVLYAPDGKTILSAGKDRSIKRSDPSTAKGLRTYSDHNEDVLALAIRPDGSEFVSAGNEPQLRWWTPDGDKPAKKQGGHGGPVHQLAFSADGSRLVSASGDGTVRLWDGKTGAAQKSLPGASDWQYAVALTPDGKVVAAGGWDGLVRLWDADAAKLRAVFVQSPALDGPAWLAVATAGAVNPSDALRPLLRWQVGGVEVAPDGPNETFLRPDRLPQALRGEPSP